MNTSTGTISFPGEGAPVPGRGDPSPKRNAYVTDVIILRLYFQAAKWKQSKEGEIKILRSRLDDKEKELQNHQQLRIAQMEQVICTRPLCDFNLDNQDYTHTDIYRPRT